MLFASMKNEEKLKEIIDLYYKDFLNKKDLPFVVKNSIPIIWFGDIDKFFSSTKRIVTISINPSLAEFSEKRFDTNARNYNELKSTLSHYFKFNPYFKWFNQYEKILNVFNSSYYGKLPNTAVHIDVYSAIATDPTWGKLTNTQKEQIKNIGLFNKLLEILSPDIILFSANKQVFNEAFYNYKLEQKNKVGNVGFVDLYKADEKKLIWGRNFNGTPFGGMKFLDILRVLNEYNL